MVRQKQVCIIGAGVSGLAAAKAFSARGHRVTIVERSGDLGGVWEPARSYPDVQTQSPKELYRYTDKAMPDSYPEWPKGPQVHAYLAEYAKDNNSSTPIRFNTAVVQMNRRPDSRAGLAARSARPGRQRQHEDFDFVAVCTGQFNEPQTLSLPGEEAFKAQGGRVMHSSQYNDPAIAKGRKVVVLGGSKSATDIAVNAVNSGASRSDAGVPRAGMADSLFHRRPGQFQAHSLHPRAGGDVPQLGHRRDVAVRACGRKAVRLGQLARAGEPAESSAQAEQVRHGAEGADRGRRQLLGADRNAGILSDGRRRPHQGHQRQL